ncbi:MAG: DMT family transporter [Pseudomonadota bacterium]|nr:DMT family transporter [Pseudomonadota bacterium]
MSILGRLSGQPYLILTLTAAMWAGNAIAGKLAVGHVSPFLLTSLRWIAALAILLAFAGPAIRRDWAAIRRHWPFLALLGIVGFTAFNNLLYLSLNYTTAINVAIIQAAMPLFVFAFNFVLFSIRSTWLQLAGFALTLAGVILTATKGNPFGLADQTINVGDLIMLAAVFAYGLYSVALVRKPPLHWLSFITVLAFFAMLSSLPFTIWEVTSGKVVWPDTQGWLVALYTALLPAILAQLMWIRGLEIIGSNRGGVFINLVPIFAAVMAVAILGEQFRFYHAIAMALVVGGVWLSQRTKPVPPQAN